MGTPIAANRIVLDKTKESGSRISAVLLFLLILAVCAGPRLRVSGDGPDRIDIRYQDILLIPAMFHLAVSNAGRLKLQLFRVIGYKLPFFIVGAVLVTIIVTFFTPDISPVRRAFFLGRGMELFIIASVAAGLFISAKPAMASRAALRAVYAAAYGNAAWMLYQLATGDEGTLLGASVGATIESYGPKLIGEGSAFGTGQFFAFTAAVTVAQMRAKYGNRFFAAVLLGVSAWGAWISESRISIGIVMLCVAVLLILGANKGRVLNIGRTGVALILGWLGVEFVLPQLQGRQSVEGVEAGVDVRIEEVWEPLMDVIGDAPLLGAGAGGLVGDLPVEAHNIYLRAVTDYGLIVGPIFILIFFTAMRRAFRASKNVELSTSTRFFANVAFLTVLGILVSGFVQDALTGVMSSHLTMIAIGLFAGAIASSQEEPVAAVEPAVRRSRNGRLQTPPRRALSRPSSVKYPRPATPSTIRLSFLASNKSALLA